MPDVNGYPYLGAEEGDADYELKIFALNCRLRFRRTARSSIPSRPTATRMPQSFQKYRLPEQSPYTDSTTGVTTYPFPFGFDPQEASGENDYSVTAGFKGLIAEWTWDLSSTYGGDQFNAYTLNSANAGVYNSTGVPTPSNYYDGYMQTTQWTSNLDVNRDFDVGMAGPLNVAYGLEYRRDSYGIGAGIPISYDRRRRAVLSGLHARPTPARTIATYGCRVYRPGCPADRAAARRCGRPLRALQRLRQRHRRQAHGAVRLHAGSSRLRGTASSGFRAPTLAEEYYSSTNVTPTSAFVQLPPNSPGGRLIGLGNGLQPEHSVNFSVGARMAADARRDRDPRPVPHHHHQPHRGRPGISTAR